MSASKYKEDLTKEVKAQAVKAAEIERDAILSHAYFYPIQGIYYALANKSVYGPIKAQLLPRFVLSALVLAVLFATVYVPQSLALSLFSGPLGFVSAVPLVLSESNILIGLLSALLIEDKKDLLFDTVLLDRGHTQLVSTGREVSAGSGPGRAGKLGGAMKAKLVSPLQRFSPEALVRYLITIPLNFIPAIGTILFITLNGRRAGPRFLARYFQLKQYSAQVREQEIEKRTGSLTAFGVVTVLLGLIPVVGQAFELTNVVGAALMASDLEGKSKNM
ncbi:Putative uncharacterized protein [Taphrina deformans PYCC 5710]|uniref:Outer spore wall protein RRT8 n=1 Tax=Taphrina deformans (strain PYCC 5710 / ATCC 11124 / CBS 356.35 / IMI 108563 / JCM 9778 / NBRC 8474) TaxID=1097556 RepID=R4XB03_TAPDE|nr:Putative uncharacterized protein [Taphrina deformans PYCC 5710]|eukprot:CCG81508.1 Putative uncharacterized protein [Taphrina deformans PYCC 5710]